VLIYSEHLKGDDGEAMFRHACAMGLEAAGWNAMFAPKRHSPDDRGQALDYPDEVLGFVRFRGRVAGAGSFGGAGPLRRPRLALTPSA
jgi:hypothetical protein